MEIAMNVSRKTPDILQMINVGKGIVLKFLFNFAK